MKMIEAKTGGKNDGMVRRGRESAPPGSAKSRALTTHKTVLWSPEVFPICSMSVSDRIVFK
jgi:hypothetical protein